MAFKHGLPVEFVLESTRLMRQKAALRLSENHITSVGAMTSTTISQLKQSTEASQRSHSHSQPATGHQKLNTAVARWLGAPLCQSEGNFAGDGDGHLF